MKNKYLLTIALSTLMSGLTACGGESANVIPEKNNNSTVNGSCTAGASNCIQFALDYPFDGLNFSCSSDTQNTFVTLMDLKNGVATGTCNYSDKVNVFLLGKADKRIALGSFPISNIALVSTNQIPRLTILDIARGMTNRDATVLDPSDATVKTAMNLVKIIQALALQQKSINTKTDIQALYMSDSIRESLDKITSSVTAQQMVNGEYAAIIKPWLDVSVISDADAFAVVSQLLNISNAAVYQPEFSLFSTSGSVMSSLTGSDGLTGCNKDVCAANDTTTKHLFGHFMLLTDRQGYTFGSGLQWRGLAKSGLTSIAGVNAELLRSYKPTRMTALPQNHWINPLNKRIDQNYYIGVDDPNSEDLIINQGKLYNDYMIAGKEKFYKLLTQKTTVTAEDLKDLGQWQQRYGVTDTFKGSLDIFKVYPITYLDKQIFKSSNNVSVGENYIFPLYADLTFKFTDSSVPSLKLGIVIDEKGDIRTNIKSAATDTDMSTGSCSTTVGSNLQDSNGVQQYRLGTTSRAFIDDRAISIRMILGDDALKSVNGALVGVNSSIQISSAGESIVVGGALVHLQNLLNASTGGTGRITFTDSAGNAVKWANSYASFQKVYNANNTDETTDDTALAKLSGGTLEMSLAPCYSVKAKS
ncbi:hypothetical protein [Acinetobacter sp. ANC 4173]|uniref:putative pilus system protein FilF n=1 Tax=Acinetobacter sp. ANC 4173 TaxID=2529837 RepID=UPI00103E18A7|nr:hypothetical protein [Acinetobacter sp. ANC 4173]TCB82444.1 hypothetical protein E0H94_02300 [Acinetobacter sp. ANC 4173]